MSAVYGRYAQLSRGNQLRHRRGRRQLGSEAVETDRDSHGRWLPVFALKARCFSVPASRVKSDPGKGQGEALAALWTLPSLLNAGSFHCESCVRDGQRGSPSQPFAPVGLAFPFPLNAGRLSYPEPRALTPRERHIGHCAVRLLYDSTR